MTTPVEQMAGLMPDAKQLLSDEPESTSCKTSHAGGYAGTVSSLIPIHSEIQRQSLCR